MHYSESRWLSWKPAVEADARRVAAIPAELRQTSRTVYRLWIEHQRHAGGPELARQVADMVAGAPHCVGTIRRVDAAQRAFVALNPTAWTVSRLERADGVPIDDSELADLRFQVCEWDASSRADRAARRRWFDRIV